MNCSYTSAQAELYSCYMMDYLETHPHSVNFNCPFVYRFLPDTGTEKILFLWEQLKKSHPVLDSYFKKEGDRWFLCYSPERANPPERESAREADMEALLQSSVRPFAINRCLIHLKLITTEKYLYFFIDIYHALTDGTGLQAIFRDYSSLWKGNPPPYDDYFSLLAERERSVLPEDRLYYEKRYSKTDWCTFLLPDKDDHGPAAYLSIPIKKNIAYSNSIFLAAVLPALAEYNAYPDVMATWTFHTRRTEAEKRSCGLLIRDYPVGIHYTGQCLKEVFYDVKEQVKNDITHSSYQYALLQYQDTPVLYTAFQKGIYDLPQLPEKESLLQRIPVRLSENAEDALLLEAMEVAGERYILIKYDSGLYRKASMQKFGSSILKNLELLGTFFNCRNIEEPLCTGKTTARSERKPKQ